MPTITQLIQRRPRKPKVKKTAKLILKFRWNAIKGEYRPTVQPQISAVVKESGIFNAKPNKPNSANRKVAAVIASNKKIIRAKIPGEGHDLQSFSQILIQGGGYKDVGGSSFSAVRGNRELGGVKGRKSSPSRYGAKGHSVKKTKTR